MICSDLVKLGQGYLTLKDAIRRLSPGGTLELASGLYAGSQSCDLEINISNVVIRGINGSVKTIIDCNHHTRHFTIFSSNVSIIGLHLQRGAPTNSLGTSGQRGGCIYAAGNSTLVSNSIFSSCWADTGGAIAAVKGYGNLTVQNVTILSSVASFGAGISSSGSLFLKDSVFESNRANVSGGAVYTLNPSSIQKPRIELSGHCAFNNNTAADGGAMYIDGGGAGAMLVVGGTASFELNQALLSGSSAVGNPCLLCNAKGGAILLVNLVVASVAGLATFRANHALQGGGIYAGGKSSLSLGGSVELTDNSAAIGGAVYIADYSALDASETVLFLRNKATAADLEAFCDNCQSLGGAIYGGYNNVSIMLSKNILLASNTADYGGAIFVEGYGAEVALMGSPIFLANNATVGGALFLNMDSLFQARISEYTNFSGNSATQSGGALKVVGLAVQNPWSHSNPASLNIAGNVFFEENRAGWGGAISSESSVDWVIAGSVVFHKNSANSNGGAVSVEASSRLYISDEVSFTQNWAEADGGAISVYDIAFLSISGPCIIKGNIALNGGGISVEKNSNATLFGGQLTNNTASENGGAVYVSVKSSFTAGFGSRIVGNVAQSGGGMDVR